MHAHGAGGERETIVFKVPRGYEALIESGALPTQAEPLRPEHVREAELVAGLRHPHVLRLLAYSDKYPVLVYEYADYGSVDWQLRNQWKPELADAALLGAQLAHALQYIHSRGLIHGDVKPHNVMIAGGVAKLGDFSSIRTVMTATSSIHAGFTPGFRAPEQVYSDLRRKARRLGLENRVDVYQLGVTLYYILTGETLDGERAAVDDELEASLKKVRSGEFRRVLKRLLEPDPEKRLSSEGAFMELKRLYERLIKATVVLEVGEAVS